MLNIGRQPGGKHRRDLKGHSSVVIGHLITCAEHRQTAQGAGGSRPPPHLDLDPLMYVEAEIFKISNPPLGYDILEPLYENV